MVSTPGNSEVVGENDVIHMENDNANKHNVEEVVQDTFDSANESVENTEEVHDSSSECDESLHPESPSHISNSINL